MNNGRAIFSPNRAYTKRLPGNQGYSSPLLVDDKGVYRAYNMVTTIVVRGGPVVVQDGCFAIMCTNIGDSQVSVNGKTLFPFAAVLPLTGLGDSFSIGGHMMDLYYGRLDVKFITTLALPQLEIIQLYYIGVLNDPLVKS